MRKPLFLKLAVGNLRKNTKICLPFILTCISTVAMFYMICSLSNNTGIRETSWSVTMMLELATRVAAVFTAIFLFYTNSFLMKRRKMEFGLYNVLGMDKKHVAIMISWETALIAAVSLVLGLAAGVALDKLMYLTLLKIIGEAVTFGFTLSMAAVVWVLGLFAIVFILLWLDSLRQIYFSKPIELLKGGQVGEKEPKTKWFMAILGVLSLGAGYALAIMMKNPIEAINMFFIATILVTIGTYLLFTAGSIAWLKLLRNNKRYYYKTKNFISVSGMMYRMKQNAAGLGNICILSTAVLIMLSTTLSLYIGLEDVLQTRYPQSIVLDIQAENRELLHNIADNVLQEKGLRQKGVYQFTYLSFAALDNGDSFAVETDSSLFNHINNVRNLIFIPLEDYNTLTTHPQTLAEDEILLYTNRIGYKHNTLHVLEETFTVKETLNELPCGDMEASDIAVSHYIITANIEIIEKIQETLEALERESWMNDSIWHRYAFDIDAEPEAIIEAGGLIQRRLEESGLRYNAECREAERAYLLNMYGGLFFLGIFLGILFIMATVLIIYYKQITEGYGDKEKFVIMKNVGLSRAEIKKTIRAQIITVFFLPLVTAGLHVAAAFPALTQILSILNLRNVPLFLGCTLVCYAVFAVFYTLVYSLTARTYYQIVG